MNTWKEKWKEDFRLRFGSRILYAMDMRGMTQRQLAAEVELTEAAVSRYINGVRLPNVYHACKIADALMVSLDWLCRGGKR